MNIGLIVASTRPKRMADQLLAWIREQAASHQEFTLNILDLREINLPFLNEPEEPSAGNYQQPHTRAWATQIAAQDAIILLTAEYNRSYPAPLKNALDTVYREWAGKPVGFVSYGWVGGARAVAHLLPTVITLGMRPVNPQVTVMVHVQLDESGKFIPIESNNKSLQSLLRNIVQEYNATV